MQAPPSASRRVTAVTSRHITAILPNLPPLPLFTHLPSALLPSFLSHFHLLSLVSEAPVFTSSDPAQDFSLVLSGSVATFSSSPASPSSLLCLLRSGDAFGLSALLEGRKRSLHYVCVDDAELLCLTRESYDAFLSSLHSPSPALALDSLPAILSIPASERDAAQISSLSSLLVASSRLFHTVDTAPLLLAAQHLQLCQAGTGDVIETAGEASKYLFIVITGACSVHQLPVPADGSQPLLPAAPPTPLLTRRSTIADTNRSFSSTVGEETRRLMEEEKQWDETRRAQHRRKQRLLAEMTDEHGVVTPPASAPRPTFRPSASLPAAAGACVSLLLPAQATAFTDSVLAPTFCSVPNQTVIASQPTTLACLSLPFLCYLLSSFHPPAASSAAIVSAVSSPPQSRSDAALTVLDSMLKSLSFFQFKQSRVRRGLCQALRYVRVAANRVVHLQGEQSELYWIVLSGSVSIHAKDGVHSVWGRDGPGSRQYELEGGVRNLSVGHLASLVDVFGPCQSVARPFTPFNESALVASSAARALPSSAITRTACELLCLSRADYVAVCEPSSDLSSYSDAIIRYCRRREEDRENDDAEKLLAPLLHFPWFSELRPDLRQMVISSLETEEVEGDVRLLEEGEETSEDSFMYVIVSGLCSVHLAGERSAARQADSKQRQRRDQQPPLLQGDSKASRDAAASSRPTTSARPATASKHLSISLPPLSAAGKGASSTLSPTASSKGGRVSVSHLSPSEVVSQYGPSVTMMPAGSHFGDVAFSEGAAGGGGRRSATIITVEPSFMLKIPRDVVVKVNYLSSVGSRLGGEDAGGAVAKAGLTQSAMVAVLSSSALFSGVLNSLSVLKRLAFHVETRRFRLGDAICTQGQKAEAVVVLVEGAAAVQRHFTVRPLLKKPTGQRSASKSQEPAETEPVQQLGSSSLVVTSGLVPPNLSFSFPLSLSSIGVSSSFGAYECLHALPFPHSLTVTSTTLQAISIKRAHFLAFFTPLVKGVARVEEEWKERERWWQHALTAELDRRLSHQLGTARDQRAQQRDSGSDGGQQPQPQDRDGAAGEKDGEQSSLRVSSVSAALSSLDITSQAAFTHISRFDHLSSHADARTRGRGAAEELQEEAKDALSGMREAQLIRSQARSVSRKGLVSDSGMQVKLGRTLALLRTRVERNERKMASKEQNLTRARQLILSEAAAAAAAAHVSAARQDEKEELLPSDVSLGRITSAEDNDAHRDLTVEMLQALRRRRREGGEVLSPRLSPFAALALPSVTHPSLPSHLHPLLHAPASITAMTQRVETVPSIPHTMLTREEVEEEEQRRSQQQQQPEQRKRTTRPKPAAQPHAEKEPDGSEEQKESEGQVTASSPPAVLSLNFHSSSVRSWQAEKRLEFARYRRTQPEHESAPDELEEVFSDDEYRSEKEASGAVSAPFAFPAPGELLFHLDRCQRDSFIQ